MVLLRSHNSQPVNHTSRSLSKCSTAPMCCETIKRRTCTRPLVQSRRIRTVRLIPNDVSSLSEARNHESLELGEVLCARSIDPFEGGRWRLRWMRANGWSRSNGYGN